MSPIPERFVQPSFIEKANQISKFHRDKKRDSPKWSAIDTARELKISTGAVSEDLLIAKWLRTHWDDINRLSSRRDAIEFIKKKKRELELRDYDD